MTHLEDIKIGDVIKFNPGYGARRPSVTVRLTQRPKLEAGKWLIQGVLLKARSRITQSAIGTERLWVYDRDEVEVK
jgi:hypothetical protein